MSADLGNRPGAVPGSTGRTTVPPPTVIIQQPGFLGRTRNWLLATLLLASLLANYRMYSSYHDYFSQAEGPSEKFHSGEHLATDKLALIRVAGVIMPPFSERVIKTIKKAREDKQVKGVLLVVESPGGTVTDSHKIYHELKKLSGEKPVVVSMGSLATSGGYFVAMGAGSNGKIFAEPTTWTGSIGVIIPHYEVTEVAQKFGFKAAPLKTGEFKDSLSPFREMTPRDKEVWDNILNQAFDLFLEVIDENRDTLTMPQVRELANGQIYTAHDARKIGMIDEIGFEEDALAELKKITHLETARVVTYHNHVDIWDVLMGSATSNDPATKWKSLLELTVPRAMYFFSGSLPLPPG